MVIVLLMSIIASLLIAIVALIAYASGVAYDLKETEEKLRKAEEKIKKRI